MTSQLRKRIESIASDRVSGASEILAAAIAVLRDAPAEELGQVAAALRAAQPSMAPMWNATAEALAGRLDRFAQRVARAPQAIARFGADLLEIGLDREAPVRIVTLSYSATVAVVLEALAERRPVAVACGEGRPALEGRRMAARLASRGIRVTYYSDAALGSALAGAEAVLVGADAVSPDWFLNKCGTRMLAAVAAQHGVPVYVAAGREKLVSEPAAAELRVHGGSGDEIWSDPPFGVAVENPYFERIPAELASAFITDAGVLSSDDLA